MNARGRLESVIRRAACRNQLRRASLALSPPCQAHRARPPTNPRSWTSLTSSTSPCLPGSPDPRQVCPGGAERPPTPTQAGTKNVSVFVCLLFPCSPFFRLRQCAVPVRHESSRRLYGTFRGPGHVRTISSCQCTNVFISVPSYFQWQDIMQVIIHRSSALAHAAAPAQDEGLATCPICLSPPVAPRMTKCGHVSCVYSFQRR